MEMEEGGNPVKIQFRYAGNRNIDQNQEVVVLSGQSAFAGVRGYFQRRPLSREALVGAERTVTRCVSGQGLHGHVGSSQLQKAESPANCGQTV